MTRTNRRITIYRGYGRDDAAYVFDHVQIAEWSAENTVLMIDHYNKVAAEGLSGRRKVHIMREHFYWFTDELIEE